MIKRILAILIARNKEFYRDKGTLTWTFLFPFLVVLGFAYAFSGKAKEQFKVGVHQIDAQHPVTETEFQKTEYVQFVPVTDLPAAIEKVKRHQFDLLLSLNPGGGGRYWINSSSPKGYLLDRVLRGSEPDAKRFVKEPAEGNEIRYVDWLIPGILSMNMMFSALFGVGYVIVRYRKNGVLKRLKATPLKPFEFLVAQVGSRLLLIQLSTVIVFLGCRALVHFPVTGSYFALFLVFSLGATSLISLGLVLAARVTSEEVAGGLLNLLSWPMMFLSGVWFSLEGASPWMIKAAKIFPLTHVIDASRAIMLEGAGITQVAPQLIFLSIASVLLLGLGSLLFRWQ